MNKSQHTKLTLEKEILPPLLPGFELKPFVHESGALTMAFDFRPLALSLHSVQNFVVSFVSPQLKQSVSFDLLICSR